VGKYDNARNEMANNATTVGIMRDPASSVMSKDVSAGVLSMTTLGLPEQKFVFNDLLMNPIYRRDSAAVSDGIYMNRKGESVVTGFYKRAKHLASLNLGWNDIAAGKTTGMSIDVIDNFEDLTNVQFCDLDSSDWRSNNSNKNRRSYACCTVSPRLVRSSVKANSLLLHKFPLTPIISATGGLGAKQLDSYITVGRLTEHVLTDREFRLFEFTSNDFNANQTTTFRASALWTEEGEFDSFWTNNPSDNLMKYGANTYGLQALNNIRASHMSLVSLQSQLLGGPPVSPTDVTNALNVALNVRADDMAAINLSNGMRNHPEYVYKSGGNLRHDAEGKRLPHGGDASGYKHKEGSITGHASGYKHKEGSITGQRTASGVHGGDASVKNGGLKIDHQVGHASVKNGGLKIDHQVGHASVANGGLKKGNETGKTHGTLTGQGRVHRVGDFFVSYATKIAMERAIAKNGGLHPTCDDEHCPAQCAWRYLPKHSKKGCWVKRCAACVKCKNEDCTGFKKIHKKHCPCVRNK
jgi:hypothetical protein